MKKCFIYALVDPISIEMRYIGKSTNPHKRLSRHLIDKQRTHKTSWIQSLRNKGLKPIYCILEQWRKSL
ncbi:MAG: GIY-YIG nuclease family protein [Nitrospirae bacterium]|nr:GIY-YIG nuclease family protein [Nitrospirota bacterium]